MYMSFDQGLVSPIQEVGYSLTNTNLRFNTVVSYPFTCQIVVKFTTANPGRKQEVVHEYHYNPLSASFI